MLRCSALIQRRPLGGGLVQTSEWSGFFCEAAPKQSPWDGHMEIGSGSCPRQPKVWSHPNSGQHECIFLFFYVGLQWVQIPVQNKDESAPFPGFAIPAQLGCEHFYAITPCRGSVSATSPTCRQCVETACHCRDKLGCLLAGDQCPWKEEYSAVCKMHQNMAQ